MHAPQRIAHREFSGAQQIVVEKIHAYSRTPCVFHSPSNSPITYPRVSRVFKTAHTSPYLQRLSTFPEGTKNSSAISNDRGVLDTLTDNIKELFKHIPRRGTSFNEQTFRNNLPDMQPPVLSSCSPQGMSQLPQQDAVHPYSDAHVASTLSLMPFSEFSKLRDDWAAKTLIRGRYRGLCGGDPAQRERREDFENIALTIEGGKPSPSSGSFSVFNSSSGKKITLPGQVEAYSRSAAGKIIDPHYQRTPLALEKTMHFLVEHYLRVPHTPLVYTDPFRIWGYLWDRFRGIRTTWGPQLPPSNVSLKGYVDNETNEILAVEDLRRESYRRVRWLEFTAAALAVGGAYLCLTPKGCQRFMQDKKQFLESMSQCFTDLTVFYRAEQRHRNAEFFSVLLLLYGLHQEMKVEDRATFCRFYNITVDGIPRLCPEPPAESVNLAQVNRELEKQPHMMEAQPVRAALELIYCWSTRRWFAFFDLCKSAKLTPLQRAVVFQSFTYARYRAVLDLVLPNYYVYPKLRVRDAMAVADLADLLMMDPDHCLQFLKSMGLEAQLELKLSEQEQQQQAESSADADGVASSPMLATAPPTSVWYLNLCQGNSDPLVTAEELENRCQNKRVLFFPTYPEFFGFRVWQEAYTRFPDAVGLARPGSNVNQLHSPTVTAAFAGCSSPVGRGALSFNTASTSQGKTKRKPSRSRAKAQSSPHHGGNENHDEEDDDYYDGRQHPEEDNFYRDEYTSEDDEEDSDDCDSGNGGEVEDDEGENSSNHINRAEHLESAPSCPRGTTPLIQSPTRAESTAVKRSTDADLLRQSGCPVNLMEVLEVYCPPYHDEVEALMLVDASQDLFAQLRQHRRAMLRRCKQARRRALHWQAVLGDNQVSCATVNYLQNRSPKSSDYFSYEEKEGADVSEGDTLSESGEDWVKKMEQESVSTCSSVFYSDVGDNDEDINGDSDAAKRAPGTADHVLNAKNHQITQNDNEQELRTGVPSVIAEARRLVQALNASKLYAEAAADQQKQHEGKKEEGEVAAEQRRASEHERGTTPITINAEAGTETKCRHTKHMTDSPTPHIPALALPETGPCSVVPLPDDYGDADEHGDSATGPRCNSQTSRVVVESPATLPTSVNSAANPSAVAGTHDERENFVETVEPHPATDAGAVRSTDDAPSQRASPSSSAKSFPNRPGWQTFSFGTAKSAIPPLQFNTAMPKVATTTTATTTSVTGTGSLFAFPGATAMASTNPSDTTTPKAHQHVEVDERDGSDDSRSSSSAPMLEYSHLKRCRKGGASHESGSEQEGEEQEEEEDVEEYDSANAYDSGSGGAIKGDGDTDTRLSSSSATSQESTENRTPVGITPAVSQGVAVEATDNKKESQRRHRTVLAPPPITAKADSFTPCSATGTRRRRSEEQDAADGLSSISSGGDADDGSRPVIHSDENTVMDIYGRLVRCAKTEVIPHPGAAQPPLPLPLRPMEVNVFAELCVPLVRNYLAWWTQVTHADRTALEVAAKCALKTKSIAAAAAVTATSQRNTSNSISRYNYHNPIDQQQRRCQAVARIMAHRAKTLLTTAVLRGSMSEYGQCMLDAATVHGAASTASTAATQTKLTNALKASTMLTLGSLWAAPAESSSAQLSSRQSNKYSCHVLHDSDDVRASLFCRGCSAAVIPRYEVQVMLAVEGGAVPVQTSTVARSPQRLQSTNTNRSTSLTSQRRLTAEIRRCTGWDCLKTLAVSLTAAVNSPAVNQRSGASRLLRTTYTAGGGAKAPDLDVSGLMKYVKASVDTMADAKISSCSAAAQTAVRRTPSTSQVVFDQSINQYVVWNPEGSRNAVPSSSSTTSTPSAASLLYKGAPDAAVLQLTSTYIFVSSRCCESANCRSQVETDLHLRRQVSTAREEELGAQCALTSLYYNEKERWLAQLLLPSPLQEYGESSAAPAGAEEEEEDVPRADLRNDRVVWLSAPVGATEGKSAAPFVARLYQTDYFTHVPVQDYSNVSASVPLATRVALFGCDVIALPRLRVRRDGGIRLLPENRVQPFSSRTSSSTFVSAMDNSNNNSEVDDLDVGIPPSTVTSLAMSSPHYTAVITVDLESAQAVSVAEHTLTAVIDSHVPHARREKGLVVSANCVSGVLICLMDAAYAGLNDNEENSSVACTVVTQQLESFFREQWDRKHGTTHTSDTCRTSVRCSLAKSQAAAYPAFVSVRVAYGDADSAAAALKRGMQSILTSYAQQAVVVLGEV